MMISSKQITASFGKALYAEDRPLFAEKNRYSTSAVVILLLELEGEQHILFQKRVLDIAQGGEVSLPGGRSEQNETAQQTALRECCEELGVSSQWITLYGRMGVWAYGTIGQFFRCSY